MKPVIVSFCYLLSSLALAAGPDDLRHLVEKSKQENKACEAAYLKAEAAGGPLLDQETGDAHFADAAHTLAAARELERFPGASRSMLAATRELVATLEKGQVVDDLGLIYELPSCRTIGYYRLGKALAESAKRFQLKGRDLAAVRAAVLGYLQKDIDEPLTLIDVMIRIALLERLQDAKVISSKEIVPLQRRAEEVKNEIRKRSAKWDQVADAASFRKLPPAERQAMARLWLDEVQKTSALRVDLKKILKDLSA